MKLHAIISTLFMLGTLMPLQAQQHRYGSQFSLGAANLHTGTGLLRGAEEPSSQGLSAAADYLHYEARLQWLMSPSWAAGLALGLEPRARATERAALEFTYFTDNGYIFSREAFLAPYLRAGLARHSQVALWRAPLSAGLKFRLGLRLALNLHYTWEAPLSQAENGPAVWTGRAAVSLSYSFGRKRESFTGPVIYGQSLLGDASSAPPDSDSLKIFSRSPDRLLPDSIHELTREEWDTANGVRKMFDRYQNDLLVEEVKPSAWTQQDLLAETSTREEVEPAPESRPAAEPTDSLLQLLAERQNAILQQLDQSAAMARLEERLRFLEQQAVTTQPATSPQPTAPATSESYRSYTGQDAALTGTAAAVGAGLGSGGQNGDLRALQRQVDSLVLALRQEQRTARSTARDTARKAHRASETPGMDRDHLRGAVVPAGGESDTISPDNIPPSPSQKAETKAPVLVREIIREKEQYTDSTTAFLMRLSDRQTRQIDSLQRALRQKSTPAEIIMPPVKVFFGLNSSQLNATARASLRSVAEIARDRPELGFAIRGFTDASGTAEYNQQLAQRRAEAVRDELVHLGLAGERLQVKSLGIDKDLEGGNASYGRRVEVIVLSPGAAETDSPEDQ